MKRLFLLGGLLAEAAAGAVISGAVAPRVTLETANKRFTVAAEGPWGGGVTGQLVAARETCRTYPFAAFPATTDVSESTLGKGALRLWMSLVWLNRDGSVRQRETFFAPMFWDRPPSNPSQLPAFDEAGFAEAEADRKNRILIPVEMPEDGKLTIVINDQRARRVRNLVNGIAYTKGHHSIEWDGRDETGRIVAPGKYALRLSTHRGLSYELLMKFANGDEDRLFTPYGPTHVPFCALAVSPDGKQVAAGSMFTEGGNAVVMMDPAGKMTRGWSEGWGLGNRARLCFVAGSNALYAIREEWAETRPGMTNTQFKIFGYDWNDDQRRVISIQPKGRPPNVFWEEERPTGFTRAAVAGAAFTAGRLYVSDRLAKRVRVFSLEEKIDRSEVTPTETAYAAEEPGVMAVDERGKIFLADGRRICVFNAERGNFEKCFTAEAEPVSMSVRDGRVYLLPEGGDSVVSCSLGGWRSRRFGETGGAYQGAWRKERLIEPTSIAAAAGGRLWVTENRMNPKRLTLWDTKTQKVIYEKLGSERYGSPGCGFDPEAPNEWIAQDAEWHVDRAAKTAEVTGVLLPQSRENGGAWNLPPNEFDRYRVFHADGRRWVWGLCATPTLFEWKDHRLIPLAMVGTPGIYAYRMGRAKTCDALIKAYAKAFPAATAGKDFIARLKQEENQLMVWVDRNGNGQLDEDEFEFLPRGSVAMNGYWGCQPSGLGFEIPVTFDSQRYSVVPFVPQGFVGPNRAPDYSVAKALAAAALASDEMPPGIRVNSRVNSFNDSHGNVIVNGEAYLLAFTRSAQFDWLMLNLWVNVHGSQRAPLPRPGELQGIDFSIGQAPLDAHRDVMALQNNHGRIFFITTDGVYLDELFTDCRVAARNDETYIGGEAFGGVFGKDLVKDRYLLQGGGGGCRVYQIKGLETLRETAGVVEVTPAQLVAAARHPDTVRRETKTNEAKALIIPYLAQADRLPPVAAWQSGAWQIRLDAGYDAQNLYLRYRVEEPSPWVNKGKDWQLLFKTGDGVDFQLASDPAAKRVSRNAAAIGDLRIFSAPSGRPEGDVTVRYRYRISENEKTKAHPADFNSPWRSYRVDDVTRLALSPWMKNRVEDSRYTVCLAIPLQELGLQAKAIAGKQFRGDFGVIFGDRDGTMNFSRVYWSNRETGLVNDVPGEMMPEPDKWGTVTFGEIKN